MSSQNSGVLVLFITSLSMASQNSEWGIIESKKNGWWILSLLGWEIILIA
jgi:hypothetical protein